MQRLRMKFAGLVTEPNQLQAGQSPLGAMRAAKNLIIRRPDMAEPRFGFERVAEITAGGSGSFRARSLHPHDKKGDATDHDILVMAYDGAAWEARWFFDNVVASGLNIAPPSSTWYAHQSAVARFSLYVTTKDGIRKLLFSGDSTADKLMYEAPQCTVSLDNTGTVAAFATDKAVAYRYLFRRTDFNGYIIRTAPSPYVRLENSSGATRNGALRIPLPAYAVAGDIVEIYRAKSLGPAASATIADEMYLAREYTLTSTDVSNGFAVVVDWTTDDNLGAALYTNAGVEGIAKANEAPPVAHCIANYRNCTWLGNIIGRHSVTLSFDETNPGDVKVNRWSTTSDDVVLGDATFVVASGTGVAIGQVVTTAGQNPTTAGAVFAANTLVTDFDSGTRTVTVSPVPIGTGGAGYPVRFHDTVTVNGVRYHADDNTTDLYRTFETVGATAAQKAARLAYMISKTSSTLLAAGIDDPLQRTGSIVIREREATETGTAITVTTSKGAAFDPIVPAAGLTSTRDTLPHALMWSKIEQPEAYPLINIARVGREDRRVLALVPLTDALLVFKEDGIWRVTGDAPDNWRIDKMSDVRLLVSRCVCVMDDWAYAWTDHGIVRVSESGVEMQPAVGDPIGVTLRAEQDDFKINFTTSIEQVYMVAHPRRQLVALSLAPVTVGDSTLATWYVFNASTGTWTTFDMRDEGHRCALYDPLREAMYVGRGGAYYEVRKEITGESVTASVRDDDHAITISAVTVLGSIGTRLTLSAADHWLPKIGDVVVKNGTNYNVISISSGEAVVDSLTISTGAATAYEMVRVEMEWHPQVAEGPHSQGQWTEMALHLRSMEGSGLGDFKVEFGAKSGRDDSLVNAVTATKASASVIAWGTTMRAYVHRENQRAQQIAPHIVIKAPGYYYALEGLSLVYQPISLEVWR